MATLLAVDDENDVLQVLELLFSMEGHRVLIARDGVEALEIVRAEQVDVVLTDLMMPRMDGLALCRRLRADARTRDVPIILHSAAGKAPPGKGELFDLFLPKPAEFERQRAAVAHALDDARARRR